MNTKKMIGLTLATAAAVAFVTAPVTSTVTFAHGSKIVKCYNTCKGKHNCKGSKGYKKMSYKKCVKLGGTPKK